MAEREIPVVGDFPSNTNKSKQPKQKVINKVEVSEMVQRKRPLGRRIADTFTGDDFQTVGQYILFDVIIPAAKSMFFDAINQGTSHLLWGEGRPHRSGGINNRDREKTAYNRMSSSGGKSGPNRELSRKSKATYNFDEIILEDRGEAEEVLDQLRTLVDQFDNASVSDFFAIMDITADFTDEKWGWMGNDLQDAKIVRVREGWLISLPRPSQLT